MVWATIWDDPEYRALVDDGGAVPPEASLVETDKGLRVQYRFGECSVLLREPILSAVRPHLDALVRRCDESHLGHLDFAPRVELLARLVCGMRSPKRAGVVASYVVGRRLGEVRECLRALEAREPVDRVRRMIVQGFDAFAI